MAHRSVLCHVVLMKLRPETPPATRELLWNRFQTLDADCGGKEAGILHYVFSENLDQRKGWHWMEVVYFSSNEALQAFRRHPKHTEVADMASKSADWVVGDYIGPPPDLS